MKLILYLTTVSLGICFTNADVYTQKYYRDERYPGKCVVEDKILSPGQSIKHPEMTCAKVTCNNSIGLASIER